MMTLILLMFVCSINGYTAAEILSLVEGGVKLKGVNNDFALESFENEIVAAPEFSWSFIFPGTNWCGNGNRAKNYNDLGIFKEVDKCCRTHDYCNDVIPGRRTKYNLKNPTFFTRVHCRCDNRFLDCLRNTNHIKGREIGNIYFNKLGTQCYKETYPATCKRTRARKCVEYSYDTSKKILYQWFDVPLY